MDTGHERGPSVLCELWKQRHLQLSAAPAWGFIGDGIAIEAAVVVIVGTGIAIDAAVVAIVGPAPAALPRACICCKSRSPSTG